MCVTHNPHSETTHGKSLWIHQREQKNNRDTPGAKLYGLSMDYLTENVVPPIVKQQMTGNRISRAHAGDVFCEIAH